MQSNKEKEVYDGILGLAQKGENIFNLKVQQIADAAGIGKGTLYEYFSSREEILAKTLIYSMDTQILCFDEKIKSVKTFEEKLCAALDFAHQSAFENSMGTIFNTAMRDVTMREKLFFFCDKRDEFMKKILEVLLKIIEVGRIENKVSKDAADDYCLMTLISVLCTVLFTTNHGGFDSWQNIRKNGLKMLCKALA